MSHLLLILMSALCGAHSAAAQRYNSSSSILSTITSASECEASCTIEYPQVKVLQWMPIQNIEYSTTLTAATLIYVINNRTNTTSTLTEYNQLPDGYTTSTPVLNSDGKVVSTITVPQPNGAALTTAIVYPTEFLDYAPSYEWQGILPTRTLSHSTCATINATTSPYSTPLATLPSHPLYPQPTTASFPSENTTDTVGTAHTLAWAVTFDNAAPSFYKTAFPDEAAFTACDFTISSFPTQAPGITHTTAKFLTERTTRYTNGIDSGPTPPVSQPAPHTEESIRPPAAPPAAPPPAITQPSVGPSPAPPQQQQQPPNIGSIIASIIANNPSAISAPPAPPVQSVQPAQPIPSAAQPALPPALIPTVINGVSTTVPGFVIGSQTAAVGATVTVNGTPVVLSAPLLPPPTGSGAGTASLGGYIISGLGGSPTAGTAAGTGVATATATASVSGVEQFMGAAERRAGGLGWAAVVGAGLGVVALL